MCFVATASGHLDQRKHGLRPQQQRAVAPVICLTYVSAQRRGCLLGFEQHPVKGAVETISPTWSSDTPHGTVAFMSL
jgi:hypothetical protein